MLFAVMFIGIQSGGYIVDSYKLLITILLVVMVVGRLYFVYWRPSSWGVMFLGVIVLGSLGRG